MLSAQPLPICATLQETAQRLANSRISALFDQDKNRASNFSCRAAGLTLDYSKQHVDIHTIESLVALAIESNLPCTFDQLTAGSKLNFTEKKAALHTLLRGTRSEILTSKYAEITASLTAMKTLVDEIHTGKRVGFNGEAFTDVINIGIGGSDLGPRMICHALSLPNAKTSTTLCRQR